jgi:hypothetical protein
MNKNNKADSKPFDLYELACKNGGTKHAAHTSQLKKIISRFNNIFVLFCFPKWFVREIIFTNKTENPFSH